MKKLFLHILFLLCALAAQARTDNAIAADRDVVTITDEIIVPETDDSSNSPRKLAFAWGADIAGGIDLSGHDMSTLGISASFGLQWKWVRFFGLCAEANTMVGNSSRTIPLSLIFRTDFRQTRQLLFMDLRGGLALNYLQDDPQESVPYGSVGLGITLATGKTFSSHIIVGYTYNGRKTCYSGDRLRDCPGMSYASMRLGVTF